MPYIKKEDRKVFNDVILKFKKAIESKGSVCAGDMNYLFTVMIHAYIKEKGLCYENLNAMVGMLECCKLELTRKVISPYEDKKIRENGDVE